jgi:hypothetical protein
VTLVHRPPHHQAATHHPDRGCLWIDGALCPHLSSSAARCRARHQGRSLRLRHAPDSTHLVSCRRWTPKQPTRRPLPLRTIGLGDSNRGVIENLSSTDFGRRGMARGAVVVIVSDGWESDRPELLGEAMVPAESRLAHHIIWVNPRKGRESFEPLTGGMAAALPSRRHIPVRAQPAGPARRHGGDRCGGRSGGALAPVIGHASPASRLNRLTRCAGFGRRVPRGDPRWPRRRSTPSPCRLPRVTAACLPRMSSRPNGRYHPSTTHRWTGMRF